MKLRYYGIIAGISFVSGLLLFAYLQEWIIIRYPLHSAPSSNTQDLSNQIIKKKIKLIFWHQGKWRTERQELIWGPHPSNNIHYLINSWLTLLDQEGIIDKKITLQTAITNNACSEVFLSFDQNLLNAEQPTYTKLMLIEGILKTIRENGIPIQGVRFLVHHQPMRDDHLDFENPWPIAGFLHQ